MGRRILKAIKEKSSRRSRPVGMVAHPHQAGCSDLDRFDYRGTVWYLATIKNLATRQRVAETFRQASGQPGAALRLRG